LGEVAKIVFGPQGMIGDAVINDGPGLMLIIEKFPWGNTLEVTRGVEAALEQMKPGLPDVQIDTKIFRPATFIEDSIKNLSNALLIGCLLVILVMIAFLYEWRAALIATVAIPLSLLAAGLLLDFSGASMNTMVLAGFVIAIGAVVDDAIIGIENIMRRLRLERSAGGARRSVARVILDASLEVRSPIVYATLIVVMGVVPVLFMKGLSGAFFQPLVLAYLLAMLASMVVAVTVTPALGLIAEQWLFVPAEQSNPRRALRLHHGGRGDGRRCRAMAASRAVAPAGLQGTRLLNALGYEPRHLSSGDGAHHPTGQ
jgi:multidrug efflux pump subunit AcrB